MIRCLSRLGKPKKLNTSSPAKKEFNHRSAPTKPKKLRKQRSEANSTEPGAPPYTSPPITKSRAHHPSRHFAKGGNVNCSYPHAHRSQTLSAIQTLPLHNLQLLQASTLPPHRIGSRGNWPAYKADGALGIHPLRVGIDARIYRLWIGEIFRCG
jgi:hypothetical protein